MDTKKCNKCGEYKEFEYFSIKRRNKDGLDGWCRVCNSLNKKLKYESHPEIFKKYGETYRSNNREKHRASSSAWAKANPERVAANKRKSIENNPDRHEKYHKEYNKQRREEKKDYNKQYYKKNKEKFFRANARRRAVKRDQMHPEHDLLIEKNLYDLATQLGDKCCNKYHVDHIWPLAKGGPHHHDNLQVITGDINQEKNDSILFKHPDIKTWCDLPDHILKWVKDNKQENFNKALKQVTRRKMHTNEEIQRLIDI